VTAHPTGPRWRLEWAFAASGDPHPGPSSKGRESEVLFARVLGKIVPLRKSPPLVTRAPGGPPPPPGAVAQGLVGGPSGRERSQRLLRAVLPGYYRRCRPVLRLTPPLSAGDRQVLVGGTVLPVAVAVP